MAKYKPGDKKPVASGIKRGQKQMRTLMRRRVEEILIANGVDAVEELLHEVRQISKPETRANIWLRLMEYTHPKLSAQQVNVTDERASAIDVTPKEVTTDELIKVANEGDKND